MLLRNLIAAAVTVCCVLPAVRSASAQSVLYDKSHITCVSRQMNVPVEAGFKKFTADITFDPARPETGKSRIEIDMDSFDIDNAEVNDEAKGKAWFDARSFPKATFVSSGIKALGGGKYEARGSLSIKGKTNEVVAPFTYKDEGGSGVFDGVFPIRRLQYNIGEGAWKDTDTVADEVQIKFHLVTSAIKPPAKK
jgi:polyisoprenoid-binding protein YceI